MFRSFLCVAAGALLLAGCTDQPSRVGTTSGVQPSTDASVDLTGTTPVVFTVPGMS